MKVKVNKQIRKNFKIKDNKTFWGNDEVYPWLREGVHKENRQQWRRKIVEKNPWLIA